MLASMIDHGNIFDIFAIDAGLILLSQGWQKPHGNHVVSDV
jgi:hypothetical protein